MPKKPKYNPQITRVKLNPEQAVLQCDCYSGGYLWDDTEYSEGGIKAYACAATRKREPELYMCDTPEPLGNPLGNYHKLTIQSS